MHESQQPYDFCGWATKFNVGCTDGRTIMPGAFEHSDGAVVPLIWNHQHSGAENVVGKAVLEARDEGMYAYGFFNGTENGQIAKELVQHGDIDSLSIFANHLREANGYVQHGEIREVSLVLTGANIEAKIEDVICHDEEDGQAAIIYPGETGLEFIMHSDEEDYEEGEDFEDYDTEIEQEIDSELEDAELEHADNSKSDSLEEIFNTLTDKQKIAVYMLLDAAANNEGDDTMKHNAFESTAQRPSIDMKAFEADVIKDIKRFGSVKESYLQHSEELIDEYNAACAEMVENGTLQHADPTDITSANFDTYFNTSFSPAFQNAMGASPYIRDEYDPMAIGFREADQNLLLPNAHELNATPKFISRNMDWVAKVLNGVKNSPFSRIKCTFADITEDEARAKGYMKGKYKKNELFTLLKRTTQPCTIYKKKAIDRDDWIDVTDFDMIAWIKAEMTVMLNEEKARAILIGDGRDSNDDDAIDQLCVRPIVNDADLFVLRWGILDCSDASSSHTVTGVATTGFAKSFINTAIKSRKNYRGAGRPVLFTTEDVLTEMLLLEDQIGHKLYKTEEEIKTALRVSEIITVPLLENFTDKDGFTVYGIIVNLSDYQVGTDTRGKRAMFDDFDIDYNKMKYLIEERFSGSLVTPFSAIVIRGVCHATTNGTVGSQEVALNDWRTIESGANAGKKENKGSSAEFRPAASNIKD